MSNEQEIIHFATIGEIFEDGVSLIFDGQDTATEKHYKVNTSIVFQNGDRVKILADSGTYVVEYVVGSPKQPGEEVVGVPAGGTTGQALVKETDEDHAAVWGIPKGTLPTGGTKGQFLVKDSAADYSASWGSPSGVVPSGGTTGQVLMKKSNVDYAAEWRSVDGTLPPGGSKNQVLMKNSATNYDASWGIPAMANAVANQYRATSDIYQIQFQTDTSGNFYIRQGTSGSWKKITIG